MSVSWSLPSLFYQLLPLVTQFLLSTLSQHRKVGVVQISSLKDPPISLRFRNSSATLETQDPGPGREMLPFQPLDIPFHLPWFQDRLLVGELAASAAQMYLPPHTHPSIRAITGTFKAPHFRGVSLLTRPPCPHPMEWAVSCSTAWHSVASTEFKIIIWNKAM